MSKVYNWQLGREMGYPFEEKHPQWQFAFVFNTNRCIGCQTCTMACKSTWTFSKGQEYMWWNNVESKPYGGYPQNWDSKLLAMLESANPGGQSWDATKSDGVTKPYGVFEGKTIFEAAEKRVGPEGVICVIQSGTHSGNQKGQSLGDSNGNVRCLRPRFASLRR